MPKARVFTTDQIFVSVTQGCGNCRWFRQEDKEDWGECWLLPPTPVVGIDDEGNAIQGNARPQIDTTICSKWEPSQ
jgi:hypothetical protein